MLSLQGLSRVRLLAALVDTAITLAAAFPVVCVRVRAFVFR